MDALELINSIRIGEDIPGFDKDSVVDVYVEVAFKDSLEGLPEGERKRRKDKFVEYYITGAGKAFIDECMSQVKFFYGQIKEGVSNLQTSVTQITASNFIPAVITTGSATSTSNPAYTIIDNVQKKKSLQVTISTINNSTLQMLHYAALLAFDIPDVVMGVISALGTVETMLNAIPEI